VPDRPALHPFMASSLNVITTERAANSSVVVHDFYDSWTPYVPASDVKPILDKVHSFYITQYGYTAIFTEGPANIINVIRLAAQGLA